MDTGLWITAGTLIGLAVIVSLVLLHDRLTLPKIEAANRRAEELLRAVLSEEQYRALGTMGYLEVPSHLIPGRIYRIRRHGPVEVHESGQFRSCLCLRPVSPLPASDLVLLHKLLLEGDEQRYIQTANVIEYLRWNRQP